MPLTDTSSTDTSSTDTSSDSASANNYRLPEGFNPDVYLRANPDLNTGIMSNQIPGDTIREKMEYHFTNFGGGEDRPGAVPIPSQFLQSIESGGTPTQYSNLNETGQGINGTATYNYLLANPDLLKDARDSGVDIDSNDLIAIGEYVINHYTSKGYKETRPFDVGLSPVEGQSIVIADTDTSSTDTSNSTQGSYIGPDGQPTTVDFNNSDNSKPHTPIEDFETYLENRPDVRDAIADGETFGLNPVFLQGQLGQSTDKRLAERHFQLYGKDEGLDITGLPTKPDTSSTDTSGTLLPDKDFYGKFLGPDGLPSQVDSVNPTDSKPFTAIDDFETYLTNKPDVAKAIADGDTFGLNPSFFADPTMRRQKLAERHFQLFGQGEGLDITGLPTVVADPVVADPVVADPVVADPVVADPVGNVDTQMNGALSGNVTTTPTVPNTDFFKDFLNKDNTGVRPDLQVDLSSFEKDYLTANPDIAQAVGNTPGAGIQHYFDFGKAEGRGGASQALQDLNPLDYQALTANPNDPNLTPEVKSRMLQGFQARDLGRATGYKGLYTGVDGGQNYDRFKTAVGSRANFADQYGVETALGKEEQQINAPTLIKNTLDTTQYLRDNIDVLANAEKMANDAGISRNDKERFDGFVNKTAQEHYDLFGKKEGRVANFSGGTELELQRLKANENEFLKSEDYAIQDDRLNVTAQTANIDNARDVVKTDVGDFTSQERYDLVAKENIEAAKQKELTDKVNAQKGIVSKDATVQGQLESLMAQFEGGEIPAFASGAIRAAEQKLASRGMGASSMAGAAIVQAAMEASTPIAAADAQTYARMNELNLNNRQQAEVLNSQMSLQLDIANLNNEQQARVTNVANRVQSLFTDQAAVNSSRQFNASNEQQNDQFFANLFNDTAKFNTSQTNGLRQFNAGQENAVEQFNSQLADNREQFNQKNSIIIDQASAVYRRNINTSNTALANAEAEYNTRNLFNISQNAQNRLLTEQKDQVNFARVNALNEKEFQNNLALSSYAYDRDLQLAGDISTGNVIGDLLGTAVEAGLKYALS
jgi:hypothetical protein